MAGIFVHFFARWALMHGYLTGKRAAERSRIVDPITVDYFVFRHSRKALGDEGIRRRASERVRGVEIARLNNERIAFISPY
jgi:hypothetical protein